LSLHNCYRWDSFLLATTEQRLLQRTLFALSSLNKTYLTFDRTAWFCQAAHMLRSTKKFIAVLIAIWLPFFSGNALAVSVAMNALGGAGHAVVAMEGEQCPHHVAADQHALPAADQSADTQYQQNSSCENSGICHQACSGYVATESFEVAQALPFALSYEPSLTQFQSVALTTLDPPPLARA